MTNVPLILQIADCFASVKLLCRTQITINAFVKQDGLQCCEAKDDTRCKDTDDDSHSYLC
jgi:hypothetical protein